VRRVAAVLLLLLAGCGDDGGGGADPFADVEGEGPDLRTHWHTAYTIDICGERQEVSTGTSDPFGLHTHDDGVVHIHPGAAQQTARAYENATVAAFLFASRSAITDEALSLSEAVTYTEGDEDAPCDGVVQVAYWPEASTAATTDPVVVTEDVGQVFFHHDREAITIAFVPEGEDVLAPTTVDQLDELAGLVP
jgi:hypothetical protein